MITLNRGGRLHQLYEFTYGHPAGYNFCGFFWLTLLALALFPLTWISYPIHIRYSNIGMRLWFTLLGWLTVFAAGTLVGQMLIHLEGTLEVFKVIATAAVVAFFSLLTIMGIGWAFVFDITPVLVDQLQAAERRKRQRVRMGQRGTISEICNVISTKRESFMGKYCPKIEWY